MSGQGPGRPWPASDRAVDRAAASRRGRPRNGPGRPGSAQLHVQTVGADRIVVSAEGDFTAASRDYVAEWLARLAAAAPTRVQVDCTGVTRMDPEIADLFVRAAGLLAPDGGVLELAHVPALRGPLGPGRARAGAQPGR